MSPPREARFHVCCINLGTGSGNTISLFGLFTFSFLSFLIYPILFDFHERGVYTWGRDNSDCTWASSFTAVSALAPLAEAKASLCPDSLDFGPSRRLRIWPSLRRILIYTENRVSPGQMRRERTRIRMSSKRHIQRLRAYRWEFFFRLLPCHIYHLLCIDFHQLL